MTEPSSPAIRALLIAPHISRQSTGEGFVAFKWAEALSSKLALTVLALQSPTHDPLQDQLPEAKVVTWPDPKILVGKRFRAMVKPDWFFFAAKVKGYLAKNPEAFDIGHQIMPLAPRYASPFRHFKMPYVIGPLGGSLPTPAGFKSEMGKPVWYTRLRALDDLRLRFDPGLRQSYSGAALVAGVAPYVEEKLRSIPLQRYENILELGIDTLPELSPKPATGAGLKLLHVGRGVRTKGLREVIRAMAQLKDLSDISLTSAGEGEEIAFCKQEAARLGVADRVRFLGLIPRAEVDELYKEADIFVFPSFREPTGGVLYEAMGWGLPIIAAATGGPNWIVDDTTGLKVPVETPEQLARDVAEAIRTLATDPELRRSMGDAGRAKLAKEGFWDQKAAALVGHYRSVLGRSDGSPEDEK
ncbi:glycosyltransferase family 4 protein [Flavimaricola marinus]|uniref:2-deoxystreptamine glucosyltransferase n=1 Tax=Flavimaricola marinus TaxID=1819565 RepID=A0A238LHZ0_9RHOB|nr:glycosyltransferase family 4 protein [Flavimaricola marinus]SMY09299.1 2-deoxystreptamine glucosyltransferase [Flavimaricola marinus]